MSYEIDANRCVTNQNNAVIKCNFFGKKEKEINLGIPNNFISQTAAHL